MGAVCVCAARARPTRASDALGITWKASKLLAVLRSYWRLLARLGGYNFGRLRGWRGWRGWRGMLGTATSWAGDDGQQGPCCEGQQAHGAGLRHAFLTFLHHRLRTLGLQSFQGCLGPFWRTSARLPARASELCLKSNVAGIPVTRGSVIGSFFGSNL
ncbi:unnamed protein product [Effrenium voratum]|nr:unnamed protein product [Effrenium voratum]